MVHADRTSCKDSTQVATVDSTRKALEESSGTEAAGHQYSVNISSSFSFSNSSSSCFSVADAEVERSASARRNVSE